MGNDQHQNRGLPNSVAFVSLFLFRLLGRLLLLLHVLDRGRVPLVLPALCVQVVEVERVDDLLLLEQELLHLATNNCRDAARLLAILRTEIVSLHIVLKVHRYLQAVLHRNTSHVWQIHT